MAKYLINVTETYRVDTENEASNLIQEAKNNEFYVLKKYSSQKKDKKQKGEIVDSWVAVTLVKQFTDEKDPEDNIEIEYKDGNSAF
jgi:hypothetical protein